VRDHAVLLAEALAQEHVDSSIHWLWRTERSLSGSRSQLRAWAGALAAELEANPPDGIVLHYSVFSYSYRGLPLFVPTVLAALARTRRPVVTILHELAYPWRRSGLHGEAWALTQRAALIAVMRSSASVVVTTPFNAEWLASRRWLPRRAVDLAPVFSNLPAPGGKPSPTDRGVPVVGLFGYAYEGAAVSLVLDALRQLHDRGLAVELRLLGAPGRSTPAAEAWLAGARARSLEQALSFSGVLPGQELAAELAACELLLHAEPSGPTSRKGTLAASLASGRPVVALDGPRRWGELVESRAALVVAPTAAALAEGVAGLLDDVDEREALGLRGGSFSERAMGVRRSARVVAGQLARAIGDRRSRAASADQWR